ncbi:hypothetical protein N7516_000393 [Penicillium verrucosum]|uniref:uncharacterized protein n=1 Tax=Penicillium verrucosum TaxID=60171 RepID=UPI0025457A2C|nr:uncharacterized protein N7516_000393 [Penicillium verrucosum]KAJ5940225.1 hypothetical protein N7516_000393 [Penicillium verrucosum]
MGLSAGPMRAPPTMGLPTPMSRKTLALSHQPVTERRLELRLLPVPMAPRLQETLMAEFGTASYAVISNHGGGGRGGSRGGARGGRGSGAGDARGGGFYGADTGPAYHGVAHPNIEEDAGRSHEPPAAGGAGDEAAVEAAPSTGDIEIPLRNRDEDFEIQMNFDGECSIQPSSSSSSSIDAVIAIIIVTIDITGQVTPKNTYKRYHRPPSKQTISTYANEGFSRVEFFPFHTNASPSTYLSIR